jgi:hypothetical protein
MQQTRKPWIHLFNSFLVHIVQVVHFAQYNYFMDFVSAVLFYNNLNKPIRPDTDASLTLILNCK